MNTVGSIECPSTFVQVGRAQLVHMFVGKVKERQPGPGALGQAGNSGGVFDRIFRVKTQMATTPGLYNETGRCNHDIRRLQKGANLVD